MATATEVGPHKGLLEWLTRQDIEHEVHEHRLTFTARETARAEGIEPKAFAKVVGVEADDGQKALVVLDAADRLSLAKAADAMKVRHVRLLREVELDALAPGCESGAVPAVGVLFGVPLYADLAVREDPEITFNAGSHRYTVQVDRAAWDRAARPIYVDLAERFEDRPAWANS
jgi:Ala-tRNA(Pro) deacylase